MSAFIVSPYHIDAIVSWCMFDRVPVFPATVTPASLARQLFDANVDSVDFRYREKNPREYTFTHRPEAQRLSPAQIIKACDCLMYQSCEVPNWEETRAHDALLKIINHAARSGPDYDAAAWALEEVTSCA